MKAEKVTVDLRALEARVGRFLKKRGERLIHRGGVYLLVNRNGIVDKDVKLEGLARKLGALKSWEKLAV